MERSSIIKWLFLALAAYLFISVGVPKIFGSGSSGQGESAVVMDSSTLCSPVPPVSSLRVRTVLWPPRRPTVERHGPPQV